MTFLAPIAALIAAGITVPALIALYFLKRRRRLLTISSTLLWRKAIQDMQVNAPFQRIRRSLLLLLQLLVLAGLLLAFARPTLRGKAEHGQRTVIVIDHSASMSATDVEPSRLAVAKQQAVDLIDGVGEGVTEGGLSDGGGAMIISVAQRAQVVQPFTTDRALLRRAVNSIRATDQQSHLGPALQLIEPFALEGAAGEDRPVMAVQVLSDGRMHDADAKLSLRRADLRFHRVGSPAPDNLAIVALAARRDVDEPQTVQVFARLANYGTTQVNANLTLQVDGQVTSVTALAVPPLRPGSGPDQPSTPGSEAVQFDLVLPGAALVEVAHDHDDNLAADNRGYLSIAPQRRLRVALVSAEGNAFLTRALKAAGVNLAPQLTPAAYEVRHAAPPTVTPDDVDTTAGGGIDVFVFDRYAPRAMPSVDSLYFDAAPPFEDLTLARPPENTAERVPGDAPADDDAPHLLLDWQRDHPVLRHVAFDELVMTRPGRLALPDAALLLAASDVGPVIAAVEADRHRHLIVAFDLLETNWPLQVSFPVFVSNAVQWLGRGWQSAAGPSYRPGQVAVIPVAADIPQVAYRGPEPLSAEVVAQQAVLPMFTRAGLYYSAEPLPEPWDRLPVNLTDARESDLRPTGRLEVATEANVAADAQTAPVRRQAWRWFIWAALALLMLEWVVYTRRMAV